jgi:hypothetical protein
VGPGGTTYNGGRQSIEGCGMASEARIVINGTALTDQEAMTVRLAVDSLANILGEEMESKDDGVPGRDTYMNAISRVQALLSSEAGETTTVN